MNTRTACILLAAASLALAFTADDDGNDLPAGSGKELVAKVCIDCHTAATFRRMRLSEDQWFDKVGDMVDRGAQAGEKEQAEIVAYLLRNFGPDSKVNVNTAAHTEVMAVLGFSIDESKALSAYRTGHAAFKDWNDVAKVPGIDAKKVEAQKDKMAF